MAVASLIRPLPTDAHNALRKRLLAWTPRTDLGRVLRTAMDFLPTDMALEVLEHITRVGIIETQLEITVFRRPESRFWAGQRVEEYGIVSRRVVTDAFVAAVVDALDVGVGFTLSNFRYHGLGTGSTAEAAAQTALVTELTTEYTGNVRATGTATQPSANIYTSTATNTLDSGTPALREHAVFTQAATGGGAMLDRSLYASITLDGTVGDGLQSAYSLTLTSGG
ncbi:MAG: hypothetical protein IT340_23090 [Chloroflexi bacterium]|nr:hypothetical protein [Chloroflexota bacterium]